MVYRNLLYSACLLVLGCKQPNLSPEMYIRWINNVSNGLVKEEIVGNVKYTVAYRPADYQLATGLLGNDSSLVAASKDDNFSFVIKMEPTDGKTQVLTINALNQQEPFERISYYLSDMQNDIQLIEGKDTLYADNFIYERYYNLSPAQNFLVGFTHKQLKEGNDLILVINDRALNTGRIHFRFDADILKKIPQLTMPL